ncbi:unnamed protein product [Brugia pahangi]|uniref:PINc domain-containing protein n=1 Tax=Brugia pahangi TaxID=6280 RepID=A0A0N4TXJ0_BRUPA|nr:unnamed protein product [Brugia pahangi]
MQWCINDANALLCWQRAKAQQIPTKTIILTAKLKKKNTNLCMQEGKKIDKEILLHSGLFFFFFFF